ncbi:hypothetical protein [Mucilaginibacter arboris]|uniref:Uncharacterized protein n=1 Tax=Mucilaginibacter arboris TaxID=2682090 RepID=A0A7K1SVM5_9SPHI|nr:hypothetical protein [Mucilaginibacter arboris]MVN21375.1 hypothetical protein [Mucilaginibacter arboris]
MLKISAQVFTVLFFIRKNGASFSQLKTGAYLFYIDKRSMAQYPCLQVKQGYPVITFLLPINPYFACFILTFIIGN